MIRQAAKHGDIGGFVTVTGHWGIWLWAKCCKQRMEFGLGLVDDVTGVVNFAIITTAVAGQ